MYNNNQKDKAVSEIVAVVLLIGLVIAGLSIVMVMLITPPPSDIPKSNIQIAYDPSSSDHVFLFHGGGDSIERKNIEIRAIDDTGSNPVDTSNIKYIASGTTTEIDWDSAPDEWDYSSILKIYEDTDKTYQIIYSSGSGKHLLKEFDRGQVSVPPPPSSVVCSGIDASFSIPTTPTAHGSWRLVSNLPSADRTPDLSSFYIVNGNKILGWDIDINLPIPVDVQRRNYLVQHVIVKTNPEGSFCSVSSPGSIYSECPDSACVADFSYYKDGSDYIFSISSPLVSAVKSCKWDFGDGTTSDLNTPPRKYYSDGKDTHFVTLTAVVERCGTDFSCSIRKLVSTQTGCGCFIPTYDRTSRDPWRVNFAWNAPPHTECSGIESSHDWSVTFDFGDGNKRTYYKTPRQPGDDIWPGSSIPHQYLTCKDYTASMSVMDITAGREINRCYRTIELPCPCDNPPTAAFDVVNFDRSTRIATLEDHSTVASVDGRSVLRWDYDYGDGTPIETFTHTSPPTSSFTHTYMNPGTYVISLTVTDSMNCRSTTTRTVSSGGVACEEGTIIADFIWSPDSSDPKKFIFTDDSRPPGNIRYWKWQFGDGTSPQSYDLDSIPSTIEHTYGSCSSYPVTLTVIDESGCEDTIIKQITCDCPKPKADFTIGQMANPREFQFTYTPETGEGPLTYLWEFGDGTTSVLQSPSRRYDTCSQHTVRLKVTNACGSWNDAIKDAICGCPNPVPKFDYSCIGPTKVQFKDLSNIPAGTGTYLWTFGDGETSTDPNPVHPYAAADTYPVTLTITASCGSSASWTKDVTVPCCQMPTPDFTYTCNPDGRTISFSDASKTYGDTITEYLWEFEPGVTSVLPNPEHTFTGDGTFPVSLTITTACGASNTFEHSVPVPCLCSPPQASFTTQTITEKPFTIRFTDTSDPKDGTLAYWNWTFGDGTSSDRQNPPDKTYSKCGEFIANLRVTNDCGAYDDTDRLICCPVFANYTYRMDPPDGDAPVTVYFTDITEGEPNAWEWNFGDGETSYLQSPVHTYTQGGNYTVSLHATSPCGGNETHSKILTIGCPDVIADFSYTIITDEPFNVSFRDFSSSGAEIVDWTWFFGDGQTSKEQNPTHQYAGRANYNVGLIVKNSCGNTAQTWRRIAYDCPELTADFFITPSSGQSPLEVQYTDNSTPLGKIMSWLWIFGDGTSYFTTNPNARNPPNHTYTKIGTYYVTLQIKNECGNPFTKVKTVTVTNPATISGYLWNDRNMNQVRDPEEAGLPGWVVTLQERIAGVWVDKDSVLTNSQGNYLFTMNDVTYGAFRVLETLQPRWNVTYSYGSGAEPYSSTLLVSSIRNYEDVNFGNVRTNTSTFEFPLQFYYGAVGSGYTGSTYDMNRVGQYWDFNTSYNWERQRLFYPPPYRITHTAQGDSSFFVTIGFYARYLIFLTGNNPPITNSYWLRYWLYPPNAGGTRTNGFDFFVPDNTDIYRPDIFFEQDTVRWFELYIPFEGSTIPYSTNSYVEAHMTGTGGSTTGCTLIAPVTQSLTWSTLYGYFTGNWDNTPYEGQWITITARNDFGTTGSPRYISSSKNVFVDWQPVTPVITSPPNNALVQGTANIIATVGGHNRDTDNVRLLIDGQDVGQLVFDSMNNIFTNSLNVEPYAGKTIEVVARAYPLPGQGTFKDSAPVYLKVESLLPIQANFTADPWTGPAPLEVAFTDTSTGGPASWLWTFSPGQTSTEQHPIHVFQNEGNYPVSLEVRNVLGNPSTITRYVNTTGLLNTINLQSTRNGVLLPGYASWIVRGTGSSVTINGIEYPVQSGDRVRLETSISQSSADIRIVGEITAFNVSGVSLSVNGALVDTGTCTAITIHDFENYHSNLKLIAYRHNSALINLLWNGAFVEVPNFRNLEISDIMPYADKTLELRMAPGDIYLDGRASAYRLYT